MAESLGTRLRQQRERQTIPLASIAEQTKISLTLLEGLERDDLLRWPTGIFRRAFVRAYAHAIGLDPDSVVREFLELHPDPVEDVAAVAAALPPTGDDLVPQGPPTRLRWLIDRAFGSFPRRRLQLNLTSQESTLETATAIDRDSTKAISPPGPGLAVAVPLSTLTAIERAATATNDAVKPTSKPRADLAAAAHLSTEVATERATTGTKDSVKQATERATAGTSDSVKPASAPDLAPAARLSTETALESPTAFGSPNAASPREPDLAAAAHLCTELGRVIEPRDVPPLLEGAAKILNAIGLIVWVWDPHGTALRPALAHGYPEDVLAQLPGVRRDADNATATAFRSAETRIVNGSDLASGAVVVPLMTPGGCGGVLAVELKDGREHNESVRALAMIFAAQLATLVGFVPLAEAVNA